MSVNETHDPRHRSWIASANDGVTDFPIQNLPFGVFRTVGGEARGGVAIGDQIVDLKILAGSGLLKGAAQEAAEAASGADLTPLVRFGSPTASALRRALSDLLRTGGPLEARARALADTLLVPMAEAEMLLPIRVRQFSDMCTSTFHIARARGNDDRGEPICPPVFRTLPVGYDGRATSVVVSGTPVRRPNGLWLANPDDAQPTFGPEPRQDYELELAIWLAGPGNALGEPVGISKAADGIFGYGLLNDWSARGIQMWESMLGPFLGKSMATTVSPWIVTAEALAPFRAAAMERPAGDPPSPPHLTAASDQEAGGLAVSFEAWLDAPDSGGAVCLCKTDLRQLYWTPAQMLAHHSSNGCALAGGDLLGSGTCSGKNVEAAGCLMERNLAGPIKLPSGASRTWIEDGDTIVLRGRAEREGYVSIGFGEARGTLLPAVAYPA